MLGYRAVVINVYRSAFDDMHHRGRRGRGGVGPRAGGHDLAAHTWTPLLDERFRRREGAYFVPDGEFDWDALGVDTYVPDLEPSDDPNAWLPGDALFVPLRDAAGQLLGVISVDEPETGPRPTDEQLDVLVTIAQHAALALRIGAGHRERHGAPAHARARAGGVGAAGRGRATWTRSCRPSRRDPGRARLRQGADRDRRPARPAAGTRASSGWCARRGALDHGASLEELEGLFSEDFEVAGCYLLPAEVAEERLGIEPTSRTAPS